MNIVLITLQIIIALGIYNVWLVRSGRSTKYRGGAAKNIKEEFAVYGLPPWFTIVIGVVKVSLATLILIGVWIPALILPATAILGFLMLGAISMHIKVRDPFIKALPASLMALLSIAIVVLAYFVVG